jgi:nucleotide-binding universal stress UspA family protein
LDSATRISLKNILYATDFSSQSEAALPYALAIARRYGSKLYAAHVISFDAPLLPSEAWAVTSAQVEREAKEGIQRVDAQLQGVPHQVFLRRGDVWEALSEIVQTREIDLLVMGTHGRTGLRKLLMGSVAEEIFRQAPCPVLTVGPKASANSKGVVELHEILFATHFGPESLAAAPYAISLAQEHQAQLALLYVLERADASIRDPELTAASLLHRLQTLVPPEAELWCHPKYFVKYGSPGDQILELANTRHANLIVLGAHRVQRHLGATTHLARTTAHKVLSQAECPVLTVRG